MSVLRGRLSPSTSKVWSCNTRRSFTWQERSRSPISSRKIVPLSAISKRPVRSAEASVKAPFLCPNISLSNRLWEIPPRFTFTKGCLARWLLIWIASAISSLPVPLSPVINTEALVFAMRAMVFNTSVKPWLRPMIWLRLNASFCSCVVSLGAVESSKAVSIRCSRAALFHGLGIKSKAPACIPCTASWILPQAVISITGVSGRNTFTCLSRVKPSSPVVERVKFISISIKSGATVRTTSIASRGPGTTCASYPARFNIKLSEERTALSSSIIRIIVRIPYSIFYQSFLFYYCDDANLQKNTVFMDLSFFIVALFHQNRLPVRYWYGNPKASGYESDKNNTNNNRARKCASDAPHLWNFERRSGPAY